MLLHAAASTADDDTWLQEMFGSFLSLNGMPPVHQVQDALQQAGRSAQQLNQSKGGVQPPTGTMLPVLHMLLPDADLPIVSQLAAMVQRSYTS